MSRFNDLITRCICSQLVPPPPHHTDTSIQATVMEATVMEGMNNSWVRYCDYDSANRLGHLFYLVDIIFYFLEEKGTL